MLLLCLLGLLALPVSAAAGEGPDFSDRPTVGQPLRFTDASGDVFRPRVLIVITGAGALRAELPAAVNDARSEEHLDLSGAPLLGRFFRPRLAPGDAARDGLPAGPLVRVGATLVLDTRPATLPIDGLDVVLTANFPRDGAVSYRLGAPRYTPAAIPDSPGEPAGTGYILDGLLVLAGTGRGPLITDWSEVAGARR